MWLPGVPTGNEGGDERWLITYADMITLLLVLFIILYSTANADLEKFQDLADALREGFNVADGGSEAEGPIGEKQGASLIFDTSGGGTSPLELFPENQIPIKIFDFAKMLQGGGDGDQGSLRSLLEGMVDEAVEALEGLEEIGDEGAGINVEYNERGIVITIFPDQILFDSGSAQLKPGFKRILDVLTEQFKRLPNNIEVQGHTDNQAISTASFPSNWELSSSRAGAVVRYMETLGLASRRLAAAGYADTRPVVDNSTRQGRARNRRVEIVVLRLRGDELPGV